MEPQAPTIPNQGQYQRKAFVSKLKGLNDHLAALIQKKIRIDLEIKKTRNSITKLRQRSSFQMKLSTAVESRTGDPYQDFPFFVREVLEERIEDQIALESDRSDDLLLEVEELKDYLYDPSDT